MGDINEPGTFPHKCSRCGVVCESIDELADPTHHELVPQDRSL